MLVVLLVATHAACWIRNPADRVTQRPSALDSAVVQVGGATLKVCYSRPAAHGRHIMGDLVPFDQPWRLGANEATSITVPFAAEIAGVKVKPGTYSLYAVPGASSWKIVVNSDVERWGIPINDAVRAHDVGTGSATTESLAAPVETLTLRFAPVTGDATELIIEWEKTRVRIPIRRAVA
jgi:hypothetical protein